MKKWCVSILFFAILSLVLLNSFVTAQTNSSNDIITNAYQCLEDKLEDKGTNLALEEAVFGTLALGRNNDFIEVIEDLEKEDCWPEPNCRLKDTAQVLLAYNRINKNTDDIEKYLISKNGTTNGLDWFLLTDIDQQTPASCSVRYNNQNFLFSINQDMKLSGNPGSCLSIIPSGYWMKIENSCLDEEFQISCDGFSGNFITTLLYQKSGSDVIYVSPNTHSAPSSGTTTEKVNALCFKSGSSCDYEGSLWATIALQKAGRDVSDFMPYLFALAEDNRRLFPSSFIYTTSRSQEHYSQIVNAQTSDGFWQAPSTAYNKFYDTALGLLALQGSSSAEETKAKEYLLRVTTPDGCWNNNNLRDTAFLLYAGWPRAGISSGGSSNGNGTSPGTLSCTSSGNYCGTFFACTNAGGQVLGNYNCPLFGEFCCSVPIASQQTCFEAGGTVCSSSQTCSGNSVPSADGSCCLGTCNTSPTLLTTECAENNGLCVTSCTSSEEQASYSCNSASQICCIPKSSSSSDSNIWLWIILLIILIALVVLGIVYRNKINLLLFKARKGKGGIKSSPAGPPRRPPFSPPAMRYPIQGRPTMPTSRPSQRPSQVDKEMEETLKKLREMSK